MADEASAREKVSREELQQKDSHKCIQSCHKQSRETLHNIRQERNQTSLSSQRHSPCLSDSLHSQSHQRYSTYIFNSYSVLFPHWLHQSLSIHLTASVCDTQGFSRGIQGRFERNKDFTKCIFTTVKICINL